MIPHFLVRIPVRRILGQMKHMQPRLTFDIRHRPFGHMRGRLIHHYDQITPRMMSQHLTKKRNYLLGCDALIMQPKNQLATTRDRRHCRHAAAFARDGLLRSLAPWCPGLAQQCRQGDVRFVLKVQNCRVIAYRAANLWQLRERPCLAFLGRQFEILAFRLLITQARFVQPTHHGLIGDTDPKLPANDLDKAARGPKIGLESMLRCRGHNDRPQRFDAKTFHNAWTPRHSFAMQPFLALGTKPPDPAMKRDPIRTICPRNFRNGQALLKDSTNRQTTRFQRRVTHVTKRSFAHDPSMSQSLSSVSIPVLQNYWNGLYAVLHVPNAPGDKGIALPPTILANLAMLALAFWLMLVGLREERGFPFAASILYFLL